MAVGDLVYDATTGHLKYSTGGHLQYKTAIPLYTGSVKMALTGSITQNIILGWTAGQTWLYSVFPLFVQIVASGANALVQISHLAAPVGGSTVNVAVTYRPADGYPSGSGTWPSPAGTNFAFGPDVW
jgi:hypothetical protein